MIYEFEGQSPDFDPAEGFVADTAAVIGNVTLKKEASIWFGTVLRGDIEPIIVGERSNIQDNSVAHTSDGYPVIIGDDVTVGHQATLHGCKVGNNCLIGMKAILLDGCEVGDNCLVGAGSLVKQNQIIPPNSLAIGSPARVIRTLTDEEITDLQRFSDRYIELQKKY